MLANFGQPLRHVVRLLRVEMVCDTSRNKDVQLQFLLPVFFFTFSPARNTKSYSLFAQKIKKKRKLEEDRERKIRVVVKKRGRKQERVREDERGHMKRKTQEEEETYKKQRHKKE